MCTCRTEAEADASKAKTAESASSKRGRDSGIGSTVDATTDTARTQIKERQIMPGLKIYHGSRIEDLAGMLVEDLSEERTEVRHQFEFLKVAVANLGN